MLNRAIEEGHLLKARAHLAAAAARIASQSLLIGRLRVRGLNTTQAEKCLQTMQRTFEALSEHKELIEEIVAHLPAPGSGRVDGDRIAKPSRMA